MKKLLLIVSIMLGLGTSTVMAEDPVGIKTVFGGAYYDVETVGDYAYVASGAGLKVFDVSNPASINLIGIYNPFHCQYRLQIINNITFR